MKTVLPPGSPRDPPWDPRGPYKGKSEPPGSAKTTKSELSLKRGTKITKSTFWARKHQKWQKSAPGRLFGVPWEPILKTMSPPGPPRDPKKTPHRIFESFSRGGEGGNFTGEVSRALGFGNISAETSANTTCLSHFAKVRFPLPLRERDFLWKSLSLSEFRQGVPERNCLETETSRRGFRRNSRRDGGAARRQEFRQLPTTRLAC